jgi:hypothetical protein
VISHHYERGPLVITSNLAYKPWAQSFNRDATLATVVLDRLLPHAETVTLEGKRTVVLTIPIDAAFPFAMLQPADSFLEVKGHLVATRTQEEPLVLTCVIGANSAITLQWRATPGRV